MSTINNTKQTYKQTITTKTEETKTTAAETNLQLVSNIYDGGWNTIETSIDISKGRLLRVFVPRSMWVILVCQVVWGLVFEIVVTILSYKCNWANLRKINNLSPGRSHWSCGCCCIPFAGKTEVATGLSWKMFYNGLWIREVLRGISCKSFTISYEFKGVGLVQMPEK